MDIHITLDVCRYAVIERVVKISSLNECDKILKISERTNGADGLYGKL